MAARKRRGGPARNRRRRRTTKARKPRWILETKDLDLMAKRRCLMILSVLSGEKSVEEASHEAEITPPLYYLLEKKALTAMLAALVPGATKDGSPAPALAQMDAKIRELEMTKRRLERLLFLTRMTVKPGPMTQGTRGRPRTTHPASEGAGSRRSRPSRKKSSKTPSPPSIPTQDGADVPSVGSAS
jgi:hypothetical protein